MLICIFVSLTILTTVIGFGLPGYDIDLDVNKPYIFQSELIYAQSEALINNKEYEIENISFNSSGNVNKAQTIEYEHKELVLFLGCGRSEIR